MKRKKKKNTKSQRKCLLFPVFFDIITKRECESPLINLSGEVANCMANIKSSAKRDLKSKELRAKNRAEKTALKTTMKKFEAAVIEGNKEAAADAYKVAVKTVDRAAGKGLLHKNNAAHKKSAMTSKLNEMA